MYAIPITLILAALVLSLFSGSAVSNYGCRGALCANGIRYSISAPLTVVGFDCGDFDLRTAFPQIVPFRKELFIVSFDRLRKVFVIEPEEELFLVRDGVSMVLRDNMVLNRGDTVKIMNIGISVTFQTGGETE